MCSSPSISAKEKEGSGLSDIPVRVLGVHSTVLGLFALWCWDATFYLKSDAVGTRNAEARGIAADLHDLR